MKVNIYYNGSLIQTVVLPKSVTDGKAAVAEVKAKIIVVPEV